MSKAIPVVSIIGKQNTGKTTLIEILISLLKKKGYRIGTIKYNIPFFQIDYEGKDTHRHYMAGADVVSISSPEKLAIIKRVGRKSPSIKTLIETNYRDVDVIFVEGYKHWNYPSIEIQQNQQHMIPKNKEYKHRLRITNTAKTSSRTPSFTQDDLDKAIHFIESKMM
ncbi:Molybdopterin-guanine dinucleotide biosynthesis adapter protein [Candidatus Brocadiaceae bacterium B188]|nr:molybdopterin-guanine dinucleotide biosynthesis protein B [Candidatus Brocadia sapporoensis]MEB2308503.1 molybdopterin-guanine dinucleotide biosynthesis protein B [Candidatus Brocadiaceae bacterium]QQR67854.1 MAG: molybdopterin-guanine dinucleotide biosynthesis protein B [Candidatus Brocadia sp.]TWU52701.1 Molybdopterin-guanine dinucleotide biosynthesis adapter protein [Candidatus Brocadiaceae bacterium B188]